MKLGRIVEMEGKAINSTTPKVKGIRNIEISFMIACHYLTTKFKSEKFVAEEKAY